MMWNIYHLKEFKVNNNVLEHPKHTFTSYSSDSKLSSSTKYKLYYLFHDIGDKPSARRAAHIYGRWNMSRLEEKYKYDNFKVS